MGKGKNLFSTNTGSRKKFLCTNGQTIKRGEGVVKAGSLRKKTFFENF